jgi:hypothetical protein
MNKKQIALAYGRWLQKHLAVVRLNNLTHGYCTICGNGIHVKVQPNIAHTTPDAASCCCPCHWGLKANK